MFQRTKICTAVLLAVGGSLVMPALAQDAAPQRVEITGSAIKRIDAETAVPVTVLKADELKKQGITTVEQILSAVSAVQISTGTTQVVGSGSGGAAFADLRGIGANKTLVLLNGRRIANNAYDSSAPDLNMIPFAAIERIEVLRDGASALYGTDAVGGVINFITRKDFTGGAITVGADKPESDGGESVQGNIGFGFGDLSTNGFNVFGFVDFNRTDRIGGTERPYNMRQPGGLSPTPFPANYYQKGDVVGNPAAPDCSDPSFLVPASSGCQIATARFVNYTPKSERTSAMLRGTLALGSSHNLSLEWFGSENKTESVIAPVPYGTLWMNPTRPDGSPNPFYPGNPGSGFEAPSWLSPTWTGDPAGSANMNPRPGVTLQPGFVVVKWRDLATGDRTDSSDNKQQRLVAQLDGSFSGWDYQVGASFNENKVKQMVSGYSNGDLITQGMLNGIINPFGPQDAAGDAFIASAGLAGNLQNARGRVTGVDGKVSRELGDWLSAGRSAALAVGFEARREDFWQAANTPFASLVQASTGIDPTSVSEGKRDVTAVFGELSVPLTKQLEATVAVRYDRYSDFGSTTNPKFTLRYEPMKSLLLRATYGTGFRAPSLYEINSSPYFTNTGTISDPVNCPGGEPIDGKSEVLNCEVQFQALYGGNKELQPEKSKNWTLGIVFEPTPDINVGVDFWWVNLTNQIGSLSEYTVVQNPGTFAGNFHRNPSGDLSIDGFSCPGADCGYLDLRTQNLGDLRSSGVDLSVGYRMRLAQAGNVRFNLSSTYVTKYEYQDYTSGPWNQNVGAFVGAGPVFRWQHSATASWNVSDWTLGWAGHYKSGYADQYADDNHVSSYTTMDAFVSWQVPMAKGMSLTLGINNFADRDPPYSNQDQVFQANYDPRYTDPTGRKYYVRASYQF